MQRMRRHPMTFLLVAAIAVMAAACGGNDAGAGGGSPGASQPGAVGGETGAPGSAAASPAGQASGDLQVWAMGNEGDARSARMADEFMEEYPDVKVERDPGRLGPGGDQAPDGDRRQADAGRQPDGHRHDGPVRARPAPSSPCRRTSTRAPFFEGAWNTNVVDGTAYGVPWYVETRLLYYRTDIAEKAGITDAADDLGRAQGDGQGDEGEGRRQVGHRPRHQELAGVPAVRVVDRRRHRRRGRRRSRSTRPQAVEALDLLRLVLRGGPDARTRARRASTSRRPSCSGTHPMFFSGPWHIGLIKDAGGADIEGKWAVAPMPRRTGRHVVRRRQQPGRLQGQQEQGRGVGVRRVPVRARDQAKWYERSRDLPAVQAAWDDPALADDPNVADLRRAAQGRQGAAGDPDLGGDRDRDQRRAREGHRRRRVARGGAQAMQQAADVDRHRQLTMASAAIGRLGRPRRPASVASAAGLPAPRRLAAAARRDSSSAGVRRSVRARLLRLHGRCRSSRRSC